MRVMPVLEAAAVPAVVLLERRLVAKPWGRPAGGEWACGAVFAEPVGEIHHLLPGVANSRDVREVMGADALLLKTLFTREMLSVQVHPDAAAARAMGMARGKDEAWLVLDAEPGAQVGLGLARPMSRAALAAAVADGSVVAAMVWHEVVPGDVLMVPAGTVHALGAGVTVLEVQENNDLTWRLFDHGRGRRLDVEKGLSVARREAWVRPEPLASPGPGRTALGACGAFVMERVRGDGVLRPAVGRPAWVAALGAGVRLGGLALEAGAVALVSDAVPVMAGEAGILVAQAGGVAQAGLWAGK
ncbi:MAG: class I mannose-6-phosphate isomerase [Polymorphobacter sp.]|uniref:class I mannose-6-phosphate isomerase n=1 Tax=Polymorphobacter sp. TaxID=1909290 RepID=UPI003A8737A0